MLPARELVSVLGNGNIGRESGASEQPQVNGLSNVPINGKCARYRASGTQFPRVPLAVIDGEGAEVKTLIPGNRSGRR